MLRKYLVLSWVAGLAISFVAMAQAAENHVLDKAPKGDVSIRTITPIFGQLLAMDFPAGFDVANEQVSGTSYLREAVPKGETVDDWSQMITVTGMRGVAQNPKLDPIRIAAEIGAGYQGGCPTSFTGVGVASAPVDGHDAFVAFLGCGTVGGHKGEPYSESTIILVVKGRQDYYTVQWAVRGAASATPQAFDRATWLRRLNQLAPIVLCDRVAGEAEPYPSCVGRKTGERFE